MTTRICARCEREIEGLSMVNPANWGERVCVPCFRRIKAARQALNQDGRQVQAYDPKGRQS